MDQERWHKLLGERVMKIRHKRDLSQFELAKKMGMSRTSLVNIEAGRQRILAFRLIQLSNALNCSPSHILGYEPLELPCTATPPTKTVTSTS